jgi:hypothetical protein
VAVPIYANGPKCQVRREARDAVLKLGAVFLAWGYIVRRIGGYNCRRITGGTGYSSHAWALSVDVNDDTNPYRLDKLVTDMSKGMIQAVYEIRTIAGLQVFRWGGDWDGRPEVPNSNYDAMHFEIILSPAELAVGFAAGSGVPQRPITWPIIRRGAVGSAVVELQRLLALGNTTGQGTFGPRTEIAVILYQKSRGLEADGIVGASTWTALLTNQPPLVIGGIRPQKIFADVSGGSSSTEAA